MAYITGHLQLKCELRVPRMRWLSMRERSFAACEYLHTSGCTAPPTRYMHVESAQRVLARQPRLASQRLRYISELLVFHNLIMIRE